jgi:hypothetical protein
MKKQPVIKEREEKDPTKEREHLGVSSDKQTNEVV